MPAAVGPAASARPDDDGAPDDARFVALMNAGEAHLENAEGAAAQESYRAAAALRPASPAAWRNLARALLLQGRAEEALPPLATARDLQPGHVATAYLTGVAHLRLGRAEQALPFLEEAVRGDPSSAALRLQLAIALQELGRPDDAVTQLQEATGLDPAFAPAWFRLAVLQRQAGDLAAFRAANLEFLRLRRLYGDVYGTPVALEASAHSKAEPAGSVPPATRAQAPAGEVAVRFREASAALLGPVQRAHALAVLAMDEAGRYELLAGGGDGALRSWWPARDGDGQQGVPAPAWSPPGEGAAPVIGVHVGNVLDAASVPGDAATGRLEDVLLLTEGDVRLLQRTAGGLLDVTAAAGLAGRSARAAAFADVDHDGDLDLALAGPTGLSLLQNDGAGTLAPLEHDAFAALGPVLDVAAADLDGNGAVDLVLARGEQPTVVVRSLRAGRLARLPEPPGPWPPARAVLLDDLDNDARPDAVLLAADRVRLLFGEAGGHVVAVEHELSGMVGVAAALVDVDNDGWLDLVVLGRGGEEGGGRLLALRNAGRQAWPDVSHALGLADLVLPAPAALFAADLDADGDTDLCVLGEDGALVALGNDGAGAGHQLKLRLVSLVNTAGAPGVHVELRAGTFFVAREVARPLPLEIGTAGHARLDSLQTVWPDGVVHTLTDVAVDEGPVSLVISERVDTGSCPFLYLWDGREWRFAHDVVGAAPLGVPAARGVALPADPYETLVLGGEDALPPTADGELLATIACELRELMILDHVRLRAVDHPLGIEVATTHMLARPPFAADRLVALAPSGHALRAAVGDDGRDRTAALREADGVHAPPGVRLPAPFLGACEPWTLELDFGPLSVERPLVLLLHGWLQWTTSSANIALSQRAGFELLWPRLEARDGGGVWQPVDAVTGLPAGKGKTVLWDLAGRLPPGADRLRITTGYEVWLDRVALLERLQDDELTVHELPFHAADLGPWGFSDLRARGPGLPTTPDPGLRRRAPAWRTAVQGWCTAYGDVTPLVEEPDGRHVLLNAGDGLLLRADAGALPPTDPARVRTFVLDLVGWAKEGDVNSDGGEHVGPLPGQPDADIDEHDDWRLRWNTRWVPADHFAPSDLRR